MKWTKDKPTREGWYWWRSSNNRYATSKIYYLKHYKAGLFAQCEEDWEEPINEMGGEWAGPLPEPED